MHDARVGIDPAGQFADQRLQNVVQGHQPLEVAVLVDDQGQCFAAGLEHLERALELGLDVQRLRTPGLFRSLANDPRFKALRKLAQQGPADAEHHVGSGAHENQIVDSEIYGNSRENVYVLRNHGNVLARSRLSGSGSAAVYIKHAARTVIEGNRIEGAVVHLRGSSHGTRLVDNVLVDGGVVLQRYKDEDPHIGTTAPSATLVRGGRIASKSSCVRVEGATATTLEKVELVCPQQLSLDGGGTVVAVGARVATVRCAGAGRLERARHVDFRLLDAAGKPVAGGELRLAEGHAAIGVTNAQGIYSGLVVESVVQCPGGKEEEMPAVIVGGAGRSRRVPLSELRGDVGL
jgi:hypothetical protein